MLVRIHQLDVHHDQVRNGKDRFHALPREIGRRLDRSVQILFLAPCQDGTRECQLQQRLPARQGHPTIRPLIERAISEHLLDDLFHGLALAYQHQRLRIARLDTGATGHTQFAPEQPAAVGRDVCPLRAPVKAHATADAPVRKDLQLGLGLERLWIVTPKAAQIAPFEEYSGPDAGPIVNGKPLNVSYDTTLHAFAPTQKDNSL